MSYIAFFEKEYLDQLSELDLSSTLTRLLKHLNQSYHQFYRWFARYM